MGVEGNIQFMDECRNYNVKFLFLTLFFSVLVYRKI